MQKQQFETGEKTRKKENSPEILENLGKLIRNLKGNPEEMLDFGILLMKRWDVLGLTWSVRPSAVCPSGAKN
jgi:hypothetical protein